MKNWVKQSNHGSRPTGIRCLFFGGGGASEAQWQKRSQHVGKKAFQLGVDFLGAARPPVSVSSDQHLPEFPSFFFEWKHKWEPNSWNVLVGPLVSVRRCEQLCCDRPQQEVYLGGVNERETFISSFLCLSQPTRETQMDGVTIR